MLRADRYPRLAVNFSFSVSHCEPATMLSCRIVPVARVALVKRPVSVVYSVTPFALSFLRPEKRPFLTVQLSPGPTVVVDEVELPSHVSRTWATRPLIRLPLRSTLNFRS